MRVGALVEYFTDEVNSGEGIISGYDPETGVITVIDNDDGLVFKGNEEHILIKDDEILTITVRYGRNQKLPSDDNVIGTKLLGGEVVGAHYYRSIDCLSIAVRALEGINTPQSSEALELIRAIQTQSRA
ncbi:hypothetical protein [Aeromonas hydrophila]|uniref:hypothetical protein n=1 Tax=Aeromonas hydrophila TaxID=644 RepID=UPI002251DBBA|nr:hypothetical protein [Aeromonas hydrophila]MCX4116745.1 hypothetical protein [Aeromonas hydrophila]